MTVDPRRYQQVVLEMLSLPEDELRVLAEKILDLDYWRKLNPELSIGSEKHAASFEATAISAQELERIREHVATRGYLQTTATLSMHAIDALRQGIDVLKQEGLPPAFCFVYDEAWLLSRTPSLDRLVISIVGDGYNQTSRIWCHYVPAVPRAGGWSPHTDGDASTPRRLTLWTPLSEATLDNGCMYVIPKDTLPQGSTTETVEREELLRGVRALPACPGQVLGWEFQVLHWGSSCSDSPGAPRVSLSVEFIGKDEVPTAREQPLIDVARGVLPSFQERLYFVCQGAIHFAPFEPALLRFKPLMERIAREAGPVA